MNSPFDRSGDLTVIDTSGRVQALSAGWASIRGLAWSPDGREVWFAATRDGPFSPHALHAVSLEGRERTLLRLARCMVLMDVSSAGHALVGYEDRRVETRGRLAGDERERDLTWYDFSSPPLLSADGRSLVFAEIGEAGGLEGDPDLRYGKFHRMFPLAALGRAAEACTLADETVAENADDMFASAVTIIKHALLGDREAVVAGVTGPFPTFFWNDPEFPAWIASWLALVGEHDQALAWLERWIDRGAINHPLLARADPFLQRLRGELRFQRLLDRVEPEWEAFVPRFRAEA